MSTEEYRSSLELSPESARLMLSGALKYKPTFVVRAQQVGQSFDFDGVGYEAGSYLVEDSEGRVSAMCRGELEEHFKPILPRTRKENNNAENH